MSGISKQDIGNGKPKKKTGAKKTLWEKRLFSQEALYDCLGALVVLEAVVGKCCLNHYIFGLLK